MQSKAYQAYARAEQKGVNPKQLERMAIAECTNRLIQAQENFQVGQAGYVPYAEAIKYNQKLWTYIQANIADNPEMGTSEVRENMLKVSLFVDQQSFEALCNPNPQNLSPLIDINKNISTGLYDLPPRAEVNFNVEDEQDRFSPSL